MSDAMTNHSDPESLAAFVDGRLEGEEHEAVTKHLQACEECQMMIREAAVFEQEEVAARKPGWAWWAAAAAVAIVVLASAPFVRHWWELKSGKKDLFAALVQPGRTTEARFSGQHLYAKLRLTYRGASDKESLDDLLIQNAADALSDVAENDQSPAGRRAAALAAATKNPADGLAILNGIQDQARDAAIWNDIAVLQNHLGKYPAARAAVDQALRRDPKMPEALFTRAVVLQRLGDPGAAAAWRQYLAVEPAGGWADEAKNKMDELNRPR
jgi:tetratricopeptide (TPR) repeat protein